MVVVVSYPDNSDLLHLVDFLRSLGKGFNTLHLVTLEGIHVVVILTLAILWKMLR